MELFISTILFLLMVTQISDVAAVINDGEVIGMAVAGCAAFVLLSVVIAIIVVSFRWKDWFNNWMKLKGKIRMPKAYFKKKKEFKKRLPTSSRASHVYEMNGAQPGPRVVDTATLVEDWRRNARHLPPRRLYEEKDVTMELGEEVYEDVEVDDEGFTIETEVLEDESVTREHMEMKPVTNGLYPVSNTHNTENGLNTTEQAHADNIAELNYSVAATSTSPTAEDKKKTGSDSSSTSSEREKVTNF